MKNEDITPHNENCRPHGYWEVYRHTGILMYKTFFNNDEQVGYEEDYWIGDELPYKTFYI